jgi:hypothetical protein
MVTLNLDNLTESALKESLEVLENSTQDVVVNLLISKIKQELKRRKDNAIKS